MLWILLVDVVIHFECAETKGLRTFAGMTNPWLGIPAADYEGHMSQVGQLQLINETFRTYYAKYLPESVLVLGATTGNGLEHIQRHTRKVTAVDINRNYLTILQKRFSHIAGLEVVHGGIETVVLEPEGFDLIFGALIFEYVDISVCLPRIASWLKPGGRLIVLLQLPSEQLPKVSDTPFTSLHSLDSIMKHVDVANFEREAEKNGLMVEEITPKQLESGKSFYVGRYKK